MLQTLMTRGYVAQEQANRGYVIGHRFFQLGSAYLEGSDLATIARPHLEALRDEVHETAYLVAFSEGEIVHLCKSGGKQAVSASARSAVREPAYCTATGKVLLSGLTPDELKKYLERIELRACTPQTITQQDAIAARRRKGRARPDLRSISRSLCRICAASAFRSAMAKRGRSSLPSPSRCRRRASSARRSPAGARLLQNKALIISQQVGLMDSG